MLNKEYLFLNNEVVDFLKNYISQLCVNRNKYFGNARTMRKIVADIIHNQNLRMAEVPAAQRTLEMIKTVTADGFDHGVGHLLLLLYDAKMPNYRKNKGLKDLGHYSEWPKVADAVIKAGSSSGRMVQFQ
jgi:hypothetical protein